MPTSRCPWRRLHTPFTGLVLAWTTACAGESPSGPAPPLPPPSQATGVASIFERTCAFSGCHAGPTPQMGMDLSPEVYHANTVNVASRQVPSLLRVSPGRPDSSYLMLKVAGLAGAVGGIGTQMPLGGQLTPAQIDSIRTWIELGAPNQ